MLLGHVAMDANRKTHLVYLLGYSLDEQRTVDRIQRGLRDPQSGPPIHWVTSGYFFGSKSDRNVKLTTSFHLVPRQKKKKSVELYLNCPIRLHGFYRDNVTVDKVRGSYRKS